MPDARFRTRPAATQELDARRLARELAAVVDGEVRFSPGSRALYTTGGSNYRQLPIGIVIPRTVEDVVAAVEVCSAHEAPVLSRGGGTSLAGQTSNVAVVLDFSKYLHDILEIDPDRRFARVQPGVILDHLRHAAERPHHLTYGPDPSTHTHCTLGGMIGNNSCGAHSVMTEFHGSGPLTADQVVELECLTYRGERFRVGRHGAGLPELFARPLHELADRYGDRVRERYPQIPRRVSGYNLDRLLPEHGFNVAAALTGTESTCVTILEATVELVHSPPARSLVVLGYEDAPTAGDHVMDVREHEPLGLEGIDDTLIEDMTLTGLHDEDLTLLPEGRGYLLVEFGGETKDEADAKAHDLMAAMKKHRGLKGMKLYDDPPSEKHVWEVLEAGLGATAFIPGKPDTYEGWEDSAVPPERVGDYLRELRKLAARYGCESALYGHYGQGCIHARWNFDLVTSKGIRTFRRFLDDASDLVLSMGGSLSGEHGDGQSRAELLPKMFGEDLVEGFREFKSIWDPDWKMNPGKVVDPYRITDNLRLGTSYNPPRVKTHFAYPHDGGSFVHATTRCVGIGNCRRTETESQVMCPSYMVTREEMHSTRGRARILWEMLNGGDLEVWRDDEVFEALDLCLACKGCTHDCPVHVDIPTLKAEFLAHYYAGKPRPRHAYAFGLIDQHARIASRGPGGGESAGENAGVQGGSRDGARARRAGVRAPAAARVVPPAAGRQPGRAEGDPLAGHLQHVLPHRGRGRGGRGVGSGRLPRDDAARACLLRAAAVRLRLSAARAPLPRARDRRAARRPAGRGGRDRHRAELSGRLQGRAAEAASGRRGRPPSLHAGGALLRVPRAGGRGGAYEAAHYELSQACGERALFPKVRVAAADTLVVADGFVFGRWSRFRTSRTPRILRVFSTNSSIISGRGTSPRR